MDKRIVDFMRAMRMAGVRISLAEGQDALRGIEHLGSQDRAIFREALRATLIKDHRSSDTFEYYFPLFFSSGQPPMQNIPDNLTPEQKQMLQDAMQALSGQMQGLQGLMQQLMNGMPFSQDQLDQMGQQAGLPGANDMDQRRWMERRMRRQAGINEMREMMEEILEELAQMGMSQEALDELREMMEQNLQGMSEQISQYAGQSIAQNMAESEPDPKDDVMDVPFNRLGQSEVDQIRAEIRRLAAKLRSRAALRQRRAKAGKIDLRRTMRNNMRYGGVPMEMRYKTRHVKPSLVLICDVSTSVRYCAEFLLTLIYELQDQVARTDSFVFNADLADISMTFREYETQDAVQKALDDNPPGYYATDLGTSLQTYVDNHMGNMGRRTTVIILGDGRNNYRDPRLDLAEDIQRKCRRLIWFVPEHPSEWGTGDSDMHEYARRSDGTYYVSNLRSLADAVDSVLADG